MIELGDRVKDTITGFSGIVTAVAYYLNGCVRICVQPEKIKDDGSLIDSEWFDDTQLEIVSKNTIGKKNVQKITGGPRSNEAPKYRR